MLEKRNLYIMFLVWDNRLLRPPRGWFLRQVPIVHWSGFDAQFDDGNRHRDDSCFVDVVCDCCPFSWRTREWIYFVNTVRTPLRWLFVGYSWEIICKINVRRVLNWNGDVVILMKFLSLTVLEIVVSTTSGATSDENLIKVTTFLFHCVWVGVGSFHQWVIPSLL